jgi:hypothetical protein
MLIRMLLPHKLTTGSPCFCSRRRRAHQPRRTRRRLNRLLAMDTLLRRLKRTYEVSAVLFPDGRVIPSSSKNAPPPQGSGMSDSEYDRILHPWGQEHFNEWAQDLRFVLDQMNRVGTDPQYHAPSLDKIDLARVGVFGQSSAAWWQRGFASWIAG